MNYSSLYENKPRGTPDFPMELYHVDRSSPRYQMPLHWHLEYELILIKSGSFTLTMDGRAMPMGPGDCAWIGEGVVHGGAPMDCVYGCVVADLSSLLHNTTVCARNAQEFLADETGFSVIFPMESPQAQLAARLFESLESRGRGYEWTAMGILWQMMGSMLRIKGPAEAVIKNRKRILQLKNVLTFIRNNYDQPVTLNELARVAGMNPKYFCRAFARMTGRTPIEYLNYFRVEQAGERLALTDEAVTDIALSCGFNDMSYFSRTFSRFKGMAPLAYRKKQAVGGEGPPASCSAETLPASHRSAQ